MAPRSHEELLHGRDAEDYSGYIYADRSANHELFDISTTINRRKSKKQVSVVDTYRASRIISSGRRLQQARVDSLRGGSSSPQIDRGWREQRPAVQFASLSWQKSSSHGKVRAKHLLAWMEQLGQQSRGLLLQISLPERACIGAIAGGLAGGFTNAALHPIDTVKTKLQMRGSVMMYAGPVDVVRKVLAAKGVAGFYSGLPAAILGSVLSSSVYFGTYEMGKGLLAAATGCPGALVPPLAAAVGNLTSSAVLVPKEVIKQRLQAGAEGSAMQVLMGTLRAEGVGGLYAGYSAALLRNLPANMLNFSTFEYLKAAWLVRSGKDRLEPWQSVLSGAAAGALSATLTTPLDVVKTRLMTQARVAVAAAGASGAKAEAAARAKVIAAYTYEGVASTLHKIWVEEGAAGLTRGMAPRLVYSACFSAVGFLSFETGKGDGGRGDGGSRKESEAPASFGKPLLQPAQVGRRKAGKIEQLGNG
eukprot:jgi/Mesen1/9616/ME000659S08983